jgi:hypothetical protein
MDTHDGTTSDLAFSFPMIHIFGKIYNYGACGTISARISYVPSVFNNSLLLTKKSSDFLSTSCNHL